MKTIFAVHVMPIVKLVGKKLKITLVKLALQGLFYIIQIVFNANK